MGTWNESVSKHKYSNDFLKKTTIIERMDNWDCIKLKSFHTTKETITRVIRQCTEWEINLRGD
jgi:hypothetical protein